jgi:hypothetical protein
MYDSRVMVISLTWSVQGCFAGHWHAMAAAAQGMAGDGDPYHACHLRQEPQRTFSKKLHSINNLDMIIMLLSTIHT